MRYIRGRGKAATPAPTRWYFDHIAPCSSKIFPGDGDRVVDFPKERFRHILLAGTRDNATLSLRASGSREWVPDLSSGRGGLSGTQ
jgi:hypothetical protein